MDREAAKRALDTFLAGRTQSADQIEFVNMIVDHLTARGILEPARLYESPFTDVTPQGPEGIFDDTTVDVLFDALNSIRQTASAA